MVWLLYFRLNLIMKILIVKLSSLGDVIQTLPVLIPLKKFFSNPHITWLIEEETADLLKEHPLVDQVIVFPKSRWIKRGKYFKNWFSWLKEGAKFIKEVRAVNYDLIIDFQGLFKSGILVMLAKGEKKVGFFPSREKAHIFLTEKIFFPHPPLHAIERYLFLVESLCGKKSTEPEFFIPIRQRHRNRVLKFFHENHIELDKPVVLLHPGTRWETKQWEEGRWAKLGDWLQTRNGAQVIFTGSKNDFFLINRIANKMKFPGINTAGRWNLNELAFLQKLSDLIIIPDSGPMHLAVAMGTPVIALFGPTEPKLTGPYGKQHQVIISSTKCRPCFKRKCDLAPCMKAITLEEVWEAAKIMLRKKEEVYGPK